MSKRRALYAGAVAGAALFLTQTNALASKALSGDVCQFDSNAVFFGGSAADPISVTWNLNTGEISAVSWRRGSEQWFSFPGNPGTVRPEPSGSYYLVDVGMTTKGYEETRYSLKGYIAINTNWPDATFAAVYEGTGTAWLGANGRVTCK